eukprot:5194267-Prorocentrum_lima.AAC.1
MTSSLVGSEMCIRDRRARVHDSISLQQDLERARDLSTRLFLHMDERGPVSYTHLTLPTICSV